MGGPNIIEGNGNTSVDIDNILDREEAPVHRILRLEATQRPPVVSRSGRVVKVGYLEKYYALRGWVVVGYPVKYVIVTLPTGIHKKKLSVVSSISFTNNAQDETPRNLPIGLRPGTGVFPFYSYECRYGAVISFDIAR